jgi:hypothetical protein
MLIILLNCKKGDYPRAANMPATFSICHPSKMPIIKMPMHVMMLPFAMANAAPIRVPEIITTLPNEPLTRFDKLVVCVLSFSKALVASHPEENNHTVAVAKRW